MPLKTYILIFCIIPLLNCVSIPGAAISPEIKSIADDTFVKVPGDSLQFWSALMTRETAERYKAIGYRTFCNVFLADTLENRINKDLYGKIFPDGVHAPNVIYQEWKTNPHLFNLSPASFSLQYIQELSDQGYLILLAYYYNHGPGHVAFLGNSGLSLSTIPAIAQLEGKNSAQLSIAWFPLVVQAGTYTGITSVAYATNGWFSSEAPPFQSGTVMFYLVRS